MFVFEETETKAEPKGESLSSNELQEQFTILVDHSKEALANANAFQDITNKLYILTMQPFLDKYLKSSNGSSSFNYHKSGLDEARKKLHKLGVTKYAMSTEILATRIHHHIIFRSVKDMVHLLHGSVWNHRWKLDCQLMKGKLDEGLKYIFKEALQRRFHLYWDYLIDGHILNLAELSIGKSLSTDEEWEDNI